ncbi:glutamate synthase subunit beta [Alkalihalobacillus sp. AL-G]|uniref:glutamate synthase subunit beta n=1 Tax=Alkalihalobacillus sp. AL-G TaxID=2926399 RepID=UPI00272BF9A8|nr:glutamate synthase subunit beta [Alkalihalobacillus sp. AL-G]WLD91563.1 glutamate synthase subunit beta [Alkalihalobacillus sp. AL-G]
MGELTGFMKYPRKDIGKRNPSTRINDWNEYTKRPTDRELKRQSSRCMDCGTPFCHTGAEWGRSTVGCPINNLIPEWNELVSDGKWKQALDRLEETNNFPEFTGRVCPAPCEGSCTLGLHSEAVTIKSIENEIIERGFENNWINPSLPQKRSGKRVAIVGSGPAGLTAADELNKKGHSVTIFERDDRPGGLLMYGIPNMKLEKEVIERRIQLLKEEGIQFVLNTEIGKDITRGQLQTEYDAVILCVGAQKPRDLPISNRDGKGIHFAMDFLVHSTKQMLDDHPLDYTFDAKGKDVIVIGGGDTGADCVATALRQTCNSVVQFGKHPSLPESREQSNPWPLPPLTFSLEYAYEEAVQTQGADPRKYEILTKEFETDSNGQVIALNTVEIKKRINQEGELVTTEIPGTEKRWPAQLVLIAIGFTGPERLTVDHFHIKETSSGTIWTEDNTYMTSNEGVFAAGDARKGQSLVVWAIREGREVAKVCHDYLAFSTQTASFG